MPVREYWSMTVAFDEVSRHLVQELGREPTPDEIAVKMSLPVDKVRKVLKIAKEPISLETPIGEEENSHLGDFIEDTSIDSPDEAAFRERLRGWLAEQKGRFPTSGDAYWAKAGEWHEALYAAGFFGTSWPERYGGQDLPPVYDVIVDEEIAKAGAPARPWLACCCPTPPMPADWPPRAPCPPVR